MLVASLIEVATGTLHRLFKMKQFICLLILLIGVLNTHGTPIHIGIGAGSSLTGLENLPTSIVSGGEEIVNGIIGGSSEASVPAEASESSSVVAESSEPSVPAEATGSSSVTAESSEPSVPAEATDSSSVTAESSSVSAASTTETSVPPEPTEVSTESSAPAETSQSPTPSTSTVTSAPSESTVSTVEVTSEPENSTNSTVPESTGSSENEESTEAESQESTETESQESTTEESENPNTCLGSCPAVDSYDSVYLVNERCDKFCQCSNGRAIVLSCPEGLHFNRVLNVCDWPINAKCVRVAILN